MGAFEDMANQRIVQGFARRTQLSPDQEVAFVNDALAMGHHPQSLDDPTYDMRGAWLAGMLNPPGQHGVSLFKGLGDERLFLPIGQGGQMLDTRTAKPTSDPNIWSGPTPDPQLLSLWQIISQAMNKP